MKTVQDAIHVLRGTDWDARFQAEKFLAETASASELLSHLDDPDWKVRLHVARENGAIHLVD